MEKEKMKCKRCGATENLLMFAKEVADELVELKLCFNCNFWNEKVLLKNLGGKINTDRGVATVVRCRGTHYMVYPMADRKNAGFLGHGGGLFVFKMLDGTLLASNNVWCQGPIPEDWKNLLPDNAERTLTWDEMCKLGYVDKSTF